MPPVTEIHGINTPLATPHRTGFQPDLDAMKRLIDFVAEKGLRAICIGGTTGEFVHFCLDDLKRMVASAVRHSRLPIIAGIGHTTLDGAVALARAAADCGAIALLVLPPYFYRYAQEEVREFYLRFAEAAPPLPILLYNLPAFSNEISAETARELLASGRFAGIKDSSGSFEAFIRLKAIRSQAPFSLLVGDDKIFTEARAQGADGVVSGVACALPELLMGIDRALQSGATSRAQVLDRRLRDFIAWVERFPAPVGIKLALADRGLPMGAEPVPLSPGRRRLAEQFSSWFREWLPATLEEAA